MRFLWEAARSTSRLRNELLLSALLVAFSPLPRLPRELPRDLSWEWNPLPGLYYFWDVSFPLLTGTRWNISQLDLLPILSPLVTFFYSFALAWFIYNHPKAAIFFLYLLFLSFLRPSNLNQDILLLLPLLPPIALLAGWFLRQIFTYSKAIAGGLLLLILTVPTYGTLTLHKFNRIKTEPNPQLLAFLSENNLRYFHANPRLVKRLVPFIKTNPKPAFIAYTDEAQTFEARLNNTYQYRSTPIGQYVIFYDLKPKNP